MIFEFVGYEKHLELSQHSRVEVSLVRELLSMNRADCFILSNFQQFTETTITDLHVGPPNLDPARLVCNVLTMVRRLHWQAGFDFGKRGRFGASFRTRERGLANLRSLLGLSAIEPKE